WRRVERPSSLDSAKPPYRERASSFGSRKARIARSRHHASERGGENRRPVIEGQGAAHQRERDGYSPRAAARERSGGGRVRPQRAALARRYHGSSGAAAREQGSDSMLVQDVMRSSVVTVTPCTTLVEAFQLSRARGIRHLPVLDDGNLVGIVSDRDLKRAIPPSATRD